jgi:conjugal transfer pilus assembly protein TraW
LKKILVGVILSTLLLTRPATAKELGSVGATWPIAEQDALAELEARAKEVDWSSVMDRRKMERSLRDYRPEGMTSLPAAKKDRTFQVDMNYTLDFDIPDGKGGILYPRGYSFNPLAYAFFPGVLVVIDGDDARQVKWFQASPYGKDHRVRLLLSGGPYYEIMARLKRPVFYANGRIAKRLGLAAVPAVVFQKGTIMEVREYAIEDKKKK